MPQDTRGWPCVPYAAVSSEEQADPTLPSVGEQLAAAERAAQAHGWPIVERIAVEGHSRYYQSIDALCADSPDYARLVELIKARRFRVLIVARYDRLGRTFGLLGAMSGLCRSAGIYIYSLQQPIEPGSSGDDSRLWMEAVGAAMAEQDNRTRVENYRMGHRGRIRQGLSNAHAFAPYGYRREGQGRSVRLVVDPSEAPWAVAMMERRAEGWGVVHIAQALDALHAPPPSSARQWEPSTVGYIVHNPVYAGYVRWREWDYVLDAKGQRRRDPNSMRETVAKGQHEPLISEELWAQVQRINSAHARQYQHRRGVYHLYAGLCRCAYCLDAMTYCGPSKRGGMRCGRYARTGGRQCHSNYHHERSLHEYVAGRVKAALMRPDAFLTALEREAQREDVANQIEALQRDIRRIDARLDGLAQALARASFTPEFLDRVAREQAELVARRRARQRDLHALLRAGERREAMGKELASLADVVGTLDELTPEEWRPILLSLIARIFLEKGKEPQIEWRV